VQAYFLMATNHPPGEPMDLANMRNQGVTHLVAYCCNDACRHQAMIDLWPTDSRSKADG
jgi:hypothetical protein